MNKVYRDESGSSQRTTRRALKGVFLVAAILALFLVSNAAQLAGVSADALVVATRNGLGTADAALREEQVLVENKTAPDAGGGAPESETASNAIDKIVAQIEPGHWYEVKNSHLRAVAPKAGPVPEQFKNGDYQLRLASIMTAWGGGGYDTKRDCLMVWGGGHVSYTGNEVYEFCLGTMRWDRVTEPSSYDATGDAPAWKDGDFKMPDGTPVTAHSYDGIEYLPNVDKFFVFGYATFKSGKPAAAWLFDPATRGWTMLDAKDSGIAAAYDPVTGKAYSHNNYRLYEFDPMSGKWAARVSGGFTWPFDLTAAVDPEHHLLVAVGKGQVFYYDMNSSKSRWDNEKKRVLTTGDNGAAGIAPGFEWDPKIGKFVAWRDGADVYTLDPRTWVWTKIAPAPGNKVIPTNGAGNGTYGRFRYIPSKDLFIVVNSVDENVYLYKLDNTAGGRATVMPPPAVDFWASKTTLTSGGTTKLTWASTNAKQCTASGGWSGEKPISGSLDTLPVKDSRTFTLTCTGEGGATEKTIAIKVLTKAELEDNIVHVCPTEAFSGACEFQDLGAAVQAAKAGDTIVLAPGTYQGCASIAVLGLTIKGKGAHLTGRACEGKAALVWKADNGRLEGLECSGVTVSDGNGACLRIEDGAKTIALEDVYFHDNDEGVLGGGSGGKILIENSRIERNGRGGRAHGLYITGAAEVVIRNSRILSTRGEGHDIKSRASRTVIEGNVIGGLDGDNSRAIDVPNGGEAVIRNNVIEKGPKSENSDLIGIALERQDRPKHSTLVENNVIVFDRPGIVFSSRSPGEIVFRNNKVIGSRDLGAKDVTAADNKFFANRSEAGLEPFPALPSP